MVLDYFLAKQKHRMWMINMKAYLLGVEEFDVENVAKHTDCDLGKWIYGFAINVFKGQPEFDELEHIHIDLHSTIVDIIKLKTEGKLEEANVAYEKLESISKRIIELLDQLENRSSRAA